MEIEWTTEVAFVTDEKRAFIKRKRDLIRSISHEILFDACMDYMKNGQWKSIEDLDEWIDAKLKEHDEACRNVKEYYDSIIYE